MQLLQRTWPQGFASSARDELVRPFLQAGHILVVVFVEVSVSSVKWTVTRVCRE